MFKNAACASFARASVAAAMGGAAILLLSSAALAADATTNDATIDDDLELSEVQVTGTRIQLPNVTSANPVATITAEEMSRLGIVNVADALTTLVPQNISTYMPTMTGDDQNGFGGGGVETLDRGSFFIGNTIANLRGMDPAFGSRTLTLVDGRRVNSTSNQADVVDLNIIPSNLLERMDVVTGGASTTYGSGAMAGVVNLVLNRRLTGFNLDMDYGINEAGDGGNPHVSASGGMSVLGGKGHILLGLEWQDQSAIRNCAAARDWCAESRGMLNNYTSSGSDVSEVFTPVPGYGDGSLDRNGDGVLNELDKNGVNDEFPARFELANVRRSQFAPTGTVYINNANALTDWRFNETGTDVEEYALGFRGGTGNAAVNGDGPLATWGTTMRPSSDRKSMFTNFEYDFSSRTTGYVQASYARTEGLNENPYTSGDYCVRFDQPGVQAEIGGTAPAQTVIFYGQGTSGAYEYDIAAELDGDNTTNPVTGQLLPAPARSTFWFNTNFRSFLGYRIEGTQNNLAVPGIASPFWVSGGANGTTWPANSGANSYTAPTGYSFDNGTIEWRRIYTSSPFGVAHYWLMYSVTITAEFGDPGTPAVLPEIGRNSYAFLNNLPAAALNQVRSGFGLAATVPLTPSNFGAIVDQQTGILATGASITAAGGTGTSLSPLYNPDTVCSGYTAMRKIWDPQVQRYTTNKSVPWNTVAGIRGRFGGDWRWEGYVQYGKTDSSSVQYDVATNLRMAMANDAVIDDNPASPTYGTPVCRVVRDGVPIVDYLGRAVSKPEELQALASGCKPLNIFGNDYANADVYMPGYEGTNTYNPYLLQQEALDYSFVPTRSSGWNDSATFNFNTSGTLWDGIGAGPLTGAFGVEVSQTRVVQTGTLGTSTFYERADLTNVWADGYGGKTRSDEAYTELNLPLISGMEGVNLLSINVGGRFTNYYNKGGAGTTGAHASQQVFNWKFQTVFEPFEWVRLRMTRSSDQRAAGFRDLFIQQPGLPDQDQGQNRWRPYNADSTEGRQERFGRTRVGNPDLHPEKSTTLTMGLVLSPGGWAQGMRFSLDYFDIRIKDSIAVPYTTSLAGIPSTIDGCWNGSGNRDPSAEDPTEVNGLIDYDFYDPLLQFYPCREIQFATNPDGTTNLTDIINYNGARAVNSNLPTQRRGMDLSLNYNFPLNRLFESLPGSLSLTVRGTRALEASGYQLSSSPGGVGLTQVDCDNYKGTWIDFNCYFPVSMVGQIRSNTFVPGVAASPKWLGNFSASYLMGDLTTTLSARYVGGAVLDNTWCDADQAAQGCPNYTTPVQTSTGIFDAYQQGSVDNNLVKSYFNFSLNGSYNVKVGNMRQFQVFGSINNLFDKSPPYTGGGISGASAQYHDIMGRSYRFGVRMKF